ncbi:Ig-like domain-containing protein, partial [Granulicella rosea]
MGKHINGFTVFMALLIAGILAGCGVETANIADTVRPVVTSTTPAQGATGVSLTPPITATFSKPMTASTLNAATFLLSGPGGASIAGVVSYTAGNNTATFTPASALALNTTYLATITTGAQDTASPANSLAVNYLWTFTTAPAPTPPTVISTVPVNGATNVPVSQLLTATFSTAMNAATINTSTFTVTAAGVPIAGAVTYSATGNIATFAPSVALPNSTTLVATISTGAQNTAGTSLAATYTWTFTTVPPLTPPTVISTVPANGATSVAVGQAVSATFSTAMNAATINGATFALQSPGGTAVGGTVTYAAATNTATFTPAANLAYGTTYIATITTGAQNVAGTPLASAYSWSFTTAASPAPPTVISTVPANGATGVLLTQAISATFSTTMNAATINGGTYVLKSPGGTAVGGTVTYVAATNTATFTPTANLAYGTTYIATITTGAQNAAGTPLASAYTWSFTTAASPAPPTVISTVPANGATGVLLTQPVSATFSTAMNASTLNSAT